MPFQRLNTRSAKVNGEMVMWIRRQYSAMHSYPSIREGLRDNFGVTLSIQQITRIAKGESFAQLPTLPTDREVDLTMHVNGRNALSAPGPSEEEIAASIAKVQALLAKDAEPREAHRYSLEAIEARERAVMGVEEGAGLTKPLGHSTQGTRAEKLLGELGQETLKHDDTNIVEPRRD